MLHSIFLLLLSNIVLAQQNCNLYFSPVKDTYEYLLRSSPMPTQPKLADRLHEIIVTHKISMDEAKQIQSTIKLNQLSLEQMDRLEDAILFARGLTNKEQPKAFSSLNEFINLSGTESLHKKFIKRMKKLDSYQKRQEFFYKLRHGRKNIQQAKRYAIEKRAKHKNIFHQCHASIRNEANLKGFKHFLTFKLLVGSSTSMSAYYLANKDDPEVTNFWGKFSYAGIRTMAWMTASSIIFSKPGGSYLKQVLTYYLFDNALLIADANAFHALFDDTPEKVEQRINELKEHPEFHIKIKEYQELLKDSTRYQELLKDFNLLYAKITNDEELKNDWEINTDWQALNPGNIEESEYRNALMRAIALEIYFEGKEDNPTLIETGSKKMDWYLFYTLHDIPQAFLDGAVDIALFKSFCLGQANPSLSFLRAAVIFTLYSSMFDNVTFPMRKNAIGE